MRRMFSLLICLIFIFSLFCSYRASADPFTAAMVGQLSYGVANLFGLNFSFSGFDNTSITTYMENQVNSYLAGRSLTEVFGSEFARAVAGKLIIPAALYNAIRNFLSDYVSNEDINQSPKDIFLQSGNRVAVSHGVKKSERFPTLDVAVWGIIDTETSQETIWQTGTYEERQELANLGIEIRGSDVYGLYSYLNASGQYNASLKIATGWNNPKILNSSIEGSIDVTPIGDDNVLQGENIFEPWAPDTNIEQMLGDIVDQTLSGDIDISGEVIDPQPQPTPAPTPYPVDPDTPLSDVPWEGLNDLLGSTAGTIGEGIRDQTDEITGAQEATTEAVETITETIEGALDTPSAEEMPQFKFDLRELFPFCIPFDIYRLLSSFDATPQAPHVRLPIVIQSIGFSYTLDLDFSAWDPVAQAMRTAELIVYAIGLAWATGKVIKW